MFKNISPDSVLSGRTCLVNLGVRSCPVRKLMCPVRSSPTIIRNKSRPYVYNILDFFPGPTALLKAVRLLIFGISSMGYEYFQVYSMHMFILVAKFSRPYVYSFCQIFQAVNLFPALRLFRLRVEKCFSVFA